MAAGDGLRGGRRRRSLARAPRTPGALLLLTDYAGTIAKPNTDPAWPWPEPRLRYANAVLAEAILATGVALADPALRRQGLDLLAWLVDAETSGGHVSPSPTGGRGRGDVRPAFDQQPIEVSTLADACARAAAADDSPLWPDTVLAAAA